MTRAQNRILDLEELSRPSFSRVVWEMKAMSDREDVSYLHPSKEWEYPWALERASLEPGLRILDAGCGASIFPVFLSAKGYEVSGVDRELPAGLDRMHDVNVEYVQGDLASLPYEAEIFDRVFCISVIEHLDPLWIPAAVQELRRVLKTGGLLLMTTDFCADAGEAMWYSGPGEPFPVDWHVFDFGLLERFLLHAPGLAVVGDRDFGVDWEEIRPRMQEFHGYPYTSVGVAFRKV
ncbi:MAG: class I SAM-dependent methyltransferase [Desulfovibrionales bacterium]